VLDRRWFHGKRCLDIGCNEGVITLAAVQRFAPLSMLGVDIDEGLIKTACRCVQPLGTDMILLDTDMLCAHSGTKTSVCKPVQQHGERSCVSETFM